MCLSRNPVHELHGEQGRLKPRLRFCIWINVCKGDAELIGWRTIHNNFSIASITGNLWDEQRMWWQRLHTCPLLMMSKVGQITHPSADELWVLHTWQVKQYRFCSHLYHRFAVILYSDITVNFKKSEFLGAAPKEPRTWFSWLPLDHWWALGTSGNQISGVPKHVPQTQGTQEDNTSTQQNFGICRKNITVFYYAGNQHWVKTQVQMRMRGDKYFIFKPYEFLSSPALSLS